MLAAGTSTLFHAPNVFAAKVEEPTPGWLADPNPGASEQDRAARLAKYFKADRSPIVCLVEAAEDERDEVRRDAVTALGAIGPLDLVVATLSKKDDPASRKAAISVLRDVARRDPDSAVALRAELEKFGGSKDWADTVESLLVGPSSREAADEAYQTRLVTLLKHEDVGVRELAIDILQAISRRGDRLGYDPDKPSDAAGVKAWHDLVLRHELRTPPAPKAK
jgi:HEAT repeat protein